MPRLFAFLAAAAAALLSIAASATDVPAEYQVQPGDVLQVTVWKEPDLTGDALVRPDGRLSFPLLDDVVASGKTVMALREEFTERLKRYVPNPVVTVAIKAIGGNHIYVLGKVQRPGEFPFVQPVDVMQALTLAGGTSSFASVNDIVILRRDHGAQHSIRFHYSAVARGKNLSENILLESGDVVVVP
jgi:polysaccharide export outer membrane protein